MLLVDDQGPFSGLGRERMLATIFNVDGGKALIACRHGRIR